MLKYTNKVQKSGNIGNGEHSADPPPNADLRRSDRADTEYKHSYNTPTLSVGSAYGV